MPYVPLRFGLLALAGLAACNTSDAPRPSALSTTASLMPTTAHAAVPSDQAASAAVASAMLNYSRSDVSTVSEDALAVLALQTNRPADLRAIATADFDPASASAKAIAAEVAASGNLAHLRVEPHGSAVVSVYRMGPGHELYLTYVRAPEGLRLARLDRAGW